MVCVRCLSTSINLPSRSTASFSSSSGNIQSGLQLCGIVYRKLNSNNSPHFRQVQLYSVLIRPVETITSKIQQHPRNITQKILHFLYVLLKILQIKKKHWISCKKFLFELFCIICSIRQQMQMEAKGWLNSSLWRFTSRSLFPGGLRLERKQTLRI
jgi:hypothetical protein